MNLYQKLQQARSEEDVKDAYIKVLGLKGYSKNLIDIQTNEIWFEAKDTSRHSTYASDELKLNRPDVGWYQVRKALQARNASGDFPPISFKAFEDAYKVLTEKLQPQVYELGFLKS